MKKIFTLISSAALLFSCVKPEMDAPVVEEISYNTTLTADIPAVKVAIDNQYTKLTWSNGDKISVLTSSGVYREFTYTGEDGAKSASFKGNLEEGETLGGYAIYPAHESHTVASSLPKVYLPNKYDWEEGQVMGPMVAKISEGTASFSHVGGLFAFDVQNLPAGTKGFKFTTSVRDITGGFAYKSSTGTLDAVESTSATYVTMSFDALEKVSNMKFFIPVPTGSYPDFTISYINENNIPVTIRQSTSTNVINAGTVKVFSASADGTAWYVTETGTTTANGLTWATATTLSNAISKAQDGDVIHVGAGTYVPDTYITGYAVTDGTAASEQTTATSADHKAFIVDKAVTLIGGYPAAGGNMAAPESNPTILSGNNTSDHVLIIAAPKAKGTVKMSGFTVSGAASANNCNNGWKLNGNVLYDYNGAVAILNTDVALESMTVSDNSTENASAVYGLYSKVNIKDCTFSRNTANGNGTLWFTAGSELTFADSEISGNSAENAAGLYLYLASGATMTANVSGVTIKNNSAATYAGGLYCRTEDLGQNMDVTIDGCTITSNTAKEGAAIRLLNSKGVKIQNTEVSNHTGGTNVGGVLSSVDASSTYENCTFSSNSGSANGIFQFKPVSTEVTNLIDGCTFKDNTQAESKVGVLYIFNQSDYANNIAITNSLFTGNSSNGRGGAIYAYGYTSGSGGINARCANSTFYGNTSTNQGTAICAYSGANTQIVTMDIISCTVRNNGSTVSQYAIYAETPESKGSATANIYNSLVTGNGSNGAYDISRKYNGALVRKSSLATKYSYDLEGTQTTLSTTFDYANMLDALNSNGVCKLLSIDSNPAATGGMPLSDLLALADENIPASVLAKDQIGNARTGNVIGAWAAVSAPTELTLSKSAVSASSEGGTYTVTVSGASGWTASTTDSWITDLTVNGTSLSFTVPEYVALEPRTGAVYVALNGRYYAITVTQEADITAYYKGATSTLGRQIAYNTSYITEVTSDSYTQIDHGVGMLKMQFKGQEAGTNYPMAMYMYEIDLTADVTLAVSCANDSNSSISATASGTTTLQTIRKQFAAMQTNRPSQVVLGGVNGDFFVAASNNLLQGACHRNGVCLKDTFYEDGNTVFAIKNDGSAMIMNQTQYAEQKDNILEAVGGRQRLLAYGEVYVTNNDVYTPRTSVGVSQDGTKVYLLVIDGRDSSWSYGATFHDAAKILLAAGAYNAINIDGGGSSIFIQRSSEDGTAYSDYTILNKPKNDDGTTIERQVVNGLAIVRK